MPLYLKYNVSLAVRAFGGGYVDLDALWDELELLLADNESRVLSIDYEQYDGDFMEIKLSHEVSQELELQLDHLVLGHIYNSDENGVNNDDSD